MIILEKKLNRIVILLFSLLFVTSNVSCAKEKESKKQPGIYSGKLAKKTDSGSGVCDDIPTIILSCIIGDKELSVCHNKAGVIFYRYGLNSDNSLELRASEKNYISFSLPGGGEKQLWFNRGKYDYVVFDSIRSRSESVEGGDDAVIASTGIHIYKNGNLIDDKLCTKFPGNHYFNTSVFEVNALEKAEQVGGSDIISMVDMTKESEKQVIYLESLLANYLTYPDLSRISGVNKSIDAWVQAINQLCADVYHEGSIRFLEQNTCRSFNLMRLLKVINQGFEKYPSNCPENQGSEIELKESNELAVLLCGEKKACINKTRKQLQPALYSDSNNCVPLWLQEKEPQVSFLCEMEDYSIGEVALGEDVKHLSVEESTLEKQCLKENEKYYECSIEINGIHYLIDESVIIAMEVLTPLQLKPGVLPFGILATDKRPEIFTKVRSALGNDVTVALTPKGEKSILSIDLCDESEFYILFNPDGNMSSLSSRLNWN